MQTQAAADLGRGVLRTLQKRRISTFEARLISGSWCAGLGLLIAAASPLRASEAPSFLVTESRLTCRSIPSSAPASTAPTASESPSTAVGKDATGG